MRYTMKTYKLGELITQRREKNNETGLPIRGVSREGLIPPKQIDADTSIYNVFYLRDFIFNPARMELNSIAFNDKYEKAICSSLYEVFYVHREDIVLPEYLKLIVKQDWFTRYCEFLGQGSAREYCRFANISEINIELPDIETQKKAVYCDKVISERIALKRRINDNLAEIAQAIYLQMFESKTADSDWLSGRVEDVLQLQRGHDLPRADMNGGDYPVAGSTGTIGDHDQFTTPAPAIVMGRSGNIGNPRLYLCKCWAHNTSLYVKEYRHSNPIWVFYLLKNLNYDGFKGGSAVPTLNRNDIHSVEISVPPIDLQNKFADRVLPLIFEQDANTKEITMLEELQNTVLATISSR